MCIILQFIIARNGTVFMWNVIADELAAWIRYALFLRVFCSVHVSRLDGYFCCVDIRFWLQTLSLPVSLTAKWRRRRSWQRWTSAISTAWVTPRSSSRLVSWVSSRSGVTTGCRQFCPTSRLAFAATWSARTTSSCKIRGIIQLLTTRTANAQMAGR